MTSIKENLRQTIFLFFLGVPLLLLVSACTDSSSEDTSGGGEAMGEASGEEEETNEAEVEDESEGAEELVETKQITSWFPQVENAGQYYAAMEGFYEEEGLDMTVEPGGPEVSSVQIVASGQAEYGMAQADQMLSAVNDGIPLVAIFTNFQTTPQGIMFHEGEPVENFDDLADGYDIYTAPGAGYWEYLVETTDIEQEQNMVYNGSNSEFMSNEKAASQMYVTSEPFYLEQEGVETDYLTIAESGYSPYGDVLFTTQEHLEENPEEVQAFVNAVTKGWEAFKEEPAPLYSYLMGLQDGLSEEQMAYATEEMQELVYGGDAEVNGVGYMSEQRWQTLIDQMTDLGLIEEGMAPEDIYTTEFLQ
ncbi:ABC transporter substrate-binding protein [Salibacterium aidingense]|uniref:ABC transporter substrate-binding protein n=1 Tax=Salibacterium aidingense TaxID=384933 RepID=UPI00040A1282|nr:ABC transporter substrate-binding protein [Salibacterium aidingense]